MPYATRQIADDLGVIAAMHSEGLDAVIAFNFHLALQHRA